MEVVMVMEVVMEVMLVVVVLVVVMDLLQGFGEQDRALAAQGLASPSVRTLDNDYVKVGSLSGEAGVSYPVCRWRGTWRCRPRGRRRAGCAEVSAEPSPGTAWQAAFTL